MKFREYSKCINILNLNAKILDHYRIRLKLTHQMQLQSSSFQKSMLLNQKFYYTVFRRLFTLIQNYHLYNCSKILFTQNSCHMKTSQLICIVNQLAVLVKIDYKNLYFTSDNWQIVFRLYVVLIITSLCLLQQI